jgi:hypothetical protein
VADGAVDRVRVGVRLAAPVDVSAWLSEGAAFDAAGADALWVDLRAAPEFDPYVLVAALSAVTFRAEVVLELGADPAGDRPRVVPTLAAVSRGRLLLPADDSASADAEPHATPAFGWESVPMPEGRAAWRETVADARQRGVPGLILPADPRLLDLLRNPDEEIDRRDLQLAQG